MLNTIDDIQTEFLVRNQTSTSVGFITDAMLNDWIRQAHLFAVSHKKWPFTEGRHSTTYASLITAEDGELRGEYPEGWRADSIRYIEIGGKRLRKLNYYSYKEFREDRADDTEKIFTDYGRLYYVNPKADVSGTVTLWGQFTPALDPTVKTDTTVFSNNEEEGNEAIVELMLSYVKTREKKLQESAAHYQKAILILEGIWKRIQDEQFAYQTRKDQSMFTRFDVLDGKFASDFKEDRFF